MTIHHSELGKKTTYSQTYSPDILFQIPRETGAPYGLDRWHCYEVSWLDVKGKPYFGTLIIDIPSQSPFMVESKSLKLYLNSLNFERLEKKEFLDRVNRDVTACCGSKISMTFQDKISDVIPEGTCLDELDVYCAAYEYDKDLLFCEQNSQNVEETLYTRLFRSNCPVTNQPDWAVVSLHYSGKKINHEGLLQYLVSFRSHQGFHESCVENIYKDILEKCAPSVLTVRANFTRRGGIDINPVRSNSASFHM